MGTNDQDNEEITHEGNYTDSFVCYVSFYKAIKDFEDPVVRDECYMALMEYGLYGNMHAVKKGTVAWGLLQQFKVQLDKNYRKRLAGEKGGRPKDEIKAKTEKKSQEPKKVGRPKKAAAAPDETPEADTAVIPLLEPAEEEAPVEVSEPSDPVKEDELLTDDATKEEELTLSDLRITPQKEKQQKKKYGENGYVRLTDEDYEDLVKNKGKELTDAAIDIYDCWLAAQSESKRKAELKKDHKFNLQVWPFQRAEEDLRKNAEKKAAGSGKVVPILPPANKNNFLNFEQNTLSAEEMQEFEAKLLEN